MAFRKTTTAFAAAAALSIIALASCSESGVPEHPLGMETPAPYEAASPPPTQIQEEEYSSSSEEAPSSSSSSKAARRVKQAAPPVYEEPPIAKPAEKPQERIEPVAQKEEPPAIEIDEEEPPAEAKDLAIAEATDFAPKEQAAASPGWRKWARISAYALAAGCAGMSIASHASAEKHRQNIVDLSKTSPSEATYSKWQKDYKGETKEVKKQEDQRTVFGIGAGAFTAAGTATFFF